MLQTKVNNLGSALASPRKGPNRCSDQSGKGWSSLGLSGITTLTVGHDGAGTEDVCLRGPNNEVYLDAGGTGVIDLRGQLKSVAASNNGKLYGIGIDGERFGFNVGVGFRGLGGTSLDRVAVGTDSTGIDEVHTDSTVVTTTLTNLSTVQE